MKKPSIWFWLISVLGFLWNLSGGYGYVMMRTKNAAYQANVPQQVLDYYYALPLLVDVIWALAVWASVLGWLLLLLRRSWAVPVLALSFAAMIIQFGYMVVTGGQSLQAEHMGSGVHIYTAILILIAAFGVWYARRQKANGVLQ